ncbi:MAG: hypothetical protein MIO92_13625 [Methanosarcinaceae archaeon]|nr:hypothetical protein [Methanosarcinaceae archaeon]
MNRTYTELAIRIKDELVDIDRSVEKALKSWLLAKSTEDNRDIYLDSVALNLHSFYSGIERIFELIVRHVDGVEIKKRETWHRELLRKASKEVGEVRPAVIGRQTSDVLDEFRRFRHLVRNVYAANLDLKKMSVLLDELPDLWPKLRDELQAFGNFLNELALENDK